MRAAALEAAGAAGRALDATAVLALRDPAWQVRVGAARGLASADPSVAAGPLAAALGDPHIDVRKAAVLALSCWARRPDVAWALDAARRDSDADVRAYARRALSDAGDEG
ncbi:HEAT repeat domain-containing protein [Microbispora sp. ATCC PTA-5024]|uniref:HEAT repeat domain-containing protein n=1 Tax=Microbispora sp. ATCC PTA-5024 TaxID=316330 RepID=UPI0003DD55A2|nr:HEAT repeat domain-containing protein [Microbispora sp. ATCC PTA-5024]ETK36086.1 hypothetical protein MPTA5024_10705 [Microbispora sp. ATCC PTA-5024]